VHIIIDFFFPLIYTFVHRTTTEVAMKNRSLGESRAFVLFFQPDRDDVRELAVVLRGLSEVASDQMWEVLDKRFPPAERPTCPGRGRLLVQSGNLRLCFSAEPYPTFTVGPVKGKG